MRAFISKQILMPNNDKPNPQQVSLEIRPEIAKGTYSNLAIITHSHSEFIIDFATMLPGLPKPDISNRIVMTPENAKRLFNALQDNIIKYEGHFGPIDITARPPKGSTINFGDLGLGKGEKS